MFIETDNREILKEIVLYDLIKNGANIDILPYFNGTKSFIFVEQEMEDLFSDNENLDITITQFNESHFSDIEDIKRSDKFYVVEKLDLATKNKLKKNGINIISQSKINKVLESKIIGEIRLKQPAFTIFNKDYTSYYEILEESYILSLGGKLTKAIPPTPLFFLGLSNLDKFYKNANDNELQLMLSLLLTKTLKNLGGEKESSIAKAVYKTDCDIKNGGNMLSSKNIFGYNLFAASQK